LVGLSQYGRHRFRWRHTVTLAVFRLIQESPTEITDPRRSAYSHRHDGIRVSEARGFARHAIRRSIAASVIPGIAEGAVMAPAQERRKAEGRPAITLRRDLNQDQQIALAELEKYGWELKFIRRPMFQQAIPVVFDSDRKSYAVLLPDGTLDHNPGFNIRK
jgi:hypothetical protein